MIIFKKHRKLLDAGRLGKCVWRLGRRYFRFFNYYIFSDRYVVRRSFKRAFGYYPNLLNPQNLNEKLAWMKLYDRERWHSFYADKYANRDYIARTFGGQYLVPLLFTTKDPRDISPDNIKSFPCIIKSNHAMAQWHIVRRPENTDWRDLQYECRDWLKHDWYRYSKEYQYKYIERRIIVEKLLETKEGKIPNDYKLHFINGDLAFIYVSYDREGINDRCIYDKDWNRLPFCWVPQETYRKDMNTSDVPRPETLDEMIRMGTEVARKFPRYIRVDFYDVDGRLYFGEITFHHGGGLDKFFPEEFNLFYGKQLTL